MHPVNFVSAVFPEDVRPWEGAALTTVCTSFENLDGHGHGVKLEAVCMLPSLALAILNWQDGVDYKFLLTKYRHLNSYILIVRDRDPGRVYPDPTTGKPRIEYTPSAFDRRHAMVGLLEMAKMLLVTGATEIHPNLPGAIPYIVAADEPRSINHPRFVTWLSSVEAVGNAPPMSVFACAHQMGSNRMSATPGAGVVDPNGRVWESEGLYVVDASVFPSASGVNPMVTNLAISDITSRKIAAGLRAETASAKL
jgi:choline dehydrogenase-like flavoprotein